jgi:cell division protease FtsH
MSTDTINIEEKKAKLNKIKENLKKSFIGLDDIIDKIIRNLEVWYIFPELLTRPTIINLWGLTGVGKTDLVRKLVAELEMEDVFLEIQLNTDTTGYEKNIQDDIKYSGIKSNEPGVLLLDEIQRFRTISNVGETIENKKYDDIWTILSDGKFSNSNKEKDTLYNILFGLMYDKESYESRDNVKNDEKDITEDEVTKHKKHNKYKNTVWSSEMFKRQLELNESIEEIMKMDIDTKISIVEEKLYSSKKIPQKVYSKLLIFVCGNLDEAYSMSDQVTDVDIDADILHEFSKSISVLNIKEALQKKFKPEQIARLGNTHIIYPSLSKKNYEDIIDLKLNDVVKSTYDRTDVNVSIADNLKSAIYRNGVFPAQGTRPLFSTINSIIENSIPEFLMNAKINNIKNITIDVHEEQYNNYLFSDIKGVTYKRSVELDLDYLKNNITSDDLSLVSAHESGHAVSYSLLFKTVPAEVVGNSISVHSSGFMLPHQMILNKNNILNKIQVLLAGVVCEEIIFGDIYKSNGCEHDVFEATRLACNYVRRWTMDGTIGTIVPINTPDGWCSTTNIEDTNSIAEQLLTEQKNKVKDLLQKNRQFLKDIIKETIKLKKLMSEDFYKIAKEYIPDIKIKKHDFKLNHNYNDSLQKFLNNE